MEITQEKSQELLQTISAADIPPDLSRKLVQEFERLKIDHEQFVLPCGHYTTAKFPFNYLDGLAMARFLKRNLKLE